MYFDRLLFKILLRGDVQRRLCSLCFIQWMAATRLTCCAATAISQKKKFPAQQLGINMPTAVIMEENFDKLLEQCEAQELEVSFELWILWISLNRQ